jgi:hypothetical protein
LLPLLRVELTFMWLLRRLANHASLTTIFVTRLGERNAACADKSMYIGALGVWQRN